MSDMTMAARIAELEMRLAGVHDILDELKARTSSLEATLRDRVGMETDWCVEHDPKPMPAERDLSRVPSLSEKDYNPRPR